jgi:hypothetical protein
MPEDFSLKASISASRCADRGAPGASTGAASSLGVLDDVADVAAETDARNFIGPWRTVFKNASADAELKTQTASRRVIICVDPSIRVVDFQI